MLVTPGSQRLTLLQTAFIRYSAISLSLYVLLHPVSELNVIRNTIDVATMTPNTSDTYLASLFQALS